MQERGEPINNRGDGGRADGPQQTVGKFCRITSGKHEHEARMTELEDGTHPRGRLRYGPAANPEGS